MSRGGYSGGSFYSSSSESIGCLDGSGDDNGHDSWPLGPCELNVITGSIAIGLLLLCCVGACTFGWYRYRRRNVPEGPCIPVNPVAATDVGTYLRALRPLHPCQSLASLYKWEGVPSVEGFAEQHHQQARSMLHSLTGQIAALREGFPLKSSVALPLQSSCTVCGLFHWKGTRSKNPSAVSHNLQSDDFVATLSSIKKHPSRTEKIRRNLTAHGKDHLGNWDGFGFVTTHLIGEPAVEAALDQLGCTITWQQSYSHTSSQELRCFGVLNGGSFVGNWCGVPMLPDVSYNFVCLVPYFYSEYCRYLRGETDGEAEEGDWEMTATTTHPKDVQSERPVPYQDPLHGRLPPLYITSDPSGGYPEVPDPAHEEAETRGCC